MAEADLILASITAAALRNGLRLQVVACVVLIAHALLISAVGLLSFALALCAFCGSTWFAMRSGFDADLFAALAKQAYALITFDDAMLRMGLIGSTGTTRSMEDRSRGAIRLLKKQVVCVVAQVLILLFATVWAVFPH